jgi:hypothetical protein
MRKPLTWRELSKRMADIKSEDLDKPVTVTGDVDPEILFGVEAKYFESHTPAPEDPFHKTLVFCLVVEEDDDEELSRHHDLGLHRHSFPQDCPKCVASMEKDKYE